MQVIFHENSLPLRNLAIVLIKIINKMFLWKLDCLHFCHKFDSQCNLFKNLTLKSETILVLHVAQLVEHLEFNQ